MTTKNILIFVGILVFLIILYFLFSGNKTSPVTSSRMAQPQSSNAFSSLTSLANAATSIFGHGGNPNTSGNSVGSAMSLVNAYTYDASGNPTSYYINGVYYDANQNIITQSQADALNS